MKRFVALKSIVWGTTVAAAVVLAMPNAAIGADLDGIAVNGMPLNGSDQSSGSFTVVAAPQTGAETVKFVLDGVYLGQVKAAPYRWRISTTAGEHTLKVRWNGASANKVVANFTVGSSGVPGISPRHNPTPTRSKSMTIIPVQQSSSVAAVAVSTAAELRAALTVAVPGETIAIADGIYTGRFTASTSGQPGRPITLVGSKNAVLTSGSSTSGYGLHITGSYWQIIGISVTNSGKGIVLDGSQHSIIDRVDVGNIGDEGVHFRHISSYSEIINSTVHDTGLKAPGYGEGIYVGSAHSNWASVMGSATAPDTTNGVIVQNNHLINNAAEGVDIKEGTTGGQLVGNVFSNAGYSGANSGDSWVDVKGNGYQIIGNSGYGTKTDAFQVHQAVVGWGNDTIFQQNTVAGGVPGHLYNVQTSVSGTVIRCQTTLATLGLSNIRCQ